MRVRKDQKGFTVVEVLIASAILAIVVLTVCAFILVGSRSYAAGNSDISVQQEAQLALNQMSDVLIDTTRSVNYAGYDTSGNAVLALKDAEFTFTPEDKSLIMYNGVVEETAPVVPGGATSQTVDPGNGNKHYHFYWSKENETLYYAELEVQPTDVDTSAIHFPTFDPADPVAAGWVELASHVTDFSVDLSQVEEKRVVQLALTFMDGRKEYVTSNNVTIRNKVGVNDAELAPLNKRKTLNVEARDSGVIIEPGEEYHFSTPKVTGDNVVDRSVTWSLASSGSPSGGTKFTDTVNGILYVATDEPAGTINVVITTNAVDSNGDHASCTVPVNIKRATSVALAKTADSNADNGPLEISPGCTFTISANVGGNKLGEVCSVCGDDTSIDKTVGHGSTLYPWHIHDPSAEPGASTQWNPTPYIDILENEPDHATFYVHPDVPTSDPEVPGQTYTVVIQAASLLSVTGNAHNRQYDPVFGGIELTFVKGQEDAEPYGGKLQYGDQTLDESIRAGLPTDYNKYVTAIRVVDNSGKDPDKVLLHYTIGGGNNLRISPDLFDLDLNGSYTFYMQALFPIAEERYVEGQGGYADDNETIKKEYFDNLSKSRPYGYEGTRYRHGKVFYAKLDKPKITFNYKGVDYKGKNITYDPVNIYTVGKGSGIIGEIKPTAYENIESNNGMNGMVYSLYEGKGSSQSEWKKWYYFDDSVMSYQGDKRLGGNTVEVSPGGNPYMKLDGDDRLSACGEYHIVPGMLYRNKKYDHYEIIGWQGFDYPNLPREERYYEFDESTIHVNVNDTFTMEIKHSDFTGQVLFPLPKEMKSSSLFPNIRNINWQTSAGSLTVPAMRDGNSYVEYITFTYVRYRYVKDDNSWEVEPVRVEYRTGEKKIRTHSYGIYKCGENGEKWECISRGTTTEKDLVCNVKRFYYNNNEYQTYFPLPHTDGFPFEDGTSDQTCEVVLYDNNMQESGKASGLTVTCNKNGDGYEIEFLKKTKDNEHDVNNHKINVVPCGTYTWQPGQTEWTWKKRNGVTYETDFVPTLKDLKLPDGNTYMMDYPLPGTDDFLFRKSGDIIKCSDEKAYDQINDPNAANVKYPFKNQGIEAEYTVTGGTHTVRFYKKEQVGTYKWKTTTYGIYEWTSGSDSWKLRSGSGGEKFTTDFNPTMYITINGTEYMVHFPLPSEEAFAKYKNGEVYTGSWEVPLYEVNDLYAESPKSVNGWVKVNCTQNGDTYTLTLSDNQWGSSTVFGKFTCSQNGTKWTKAN